MKLSLVLLLITALQGCGTITTLSSTDSRISSQLEQRKSHCDSLPRIYSGVAYDFCNLNSSPGGTDIDFLVSFYMVDGVLSAVADTVALPYTAFQQSDKGSIQIAH